MAEGTVARRRARRKRTRTQIVLSILSCLHFHDGLRRTELAERLSLNGAHTARWMYQMCRLNIIQECHSQMYLTEKGERALALLQEYYQLMGVDVARLLGDLSRDMPAARSTEQAEGLAPPSADGILT